MIDDTEDMAGRMIRRYPLFLRPEVRSFGLQVDTKIRKNRAAGRFPSIFCQGLAYRAVVDRAAEVSLFYDRTAGQKRGDLFADGGGFGDFEHDEDGLVVPRDKK